MELNKQLEELENNACDVVIQNDPIPNKPMLICKGFLGKNALIKPYGDLKMGFYIDDDELYKEFISKKGNEGRNLGTDINLIQQTINDYFVGKDSGVEEVIENLKQKSQYIHSVKEYKSHGGVCAHKSAVANNLLTMLGYDCEMVWSNIGSENHAFIIIHDNDKHYIFDPSNRSKLQDKSGHEWKVPTLVEKTDEEIKAFYDGKEDLVISDEDEKIKNYKQNNPDYHIRLPKIRYSTRDKIKDINAQRETADNVIEKYVAELKAKGLSENEIVKVLGKVRQDAILGMTPKVPKLETVYNAMRNKETNNETNTQKEKSNNKSTK